MTYICIIILQRGHIPNNFYSPQILSSFEWCMLFVEREYDIPIRYKDDLFTLNFQVGMDQHEGCYDNKYQAIDDFDDGDNDDI